MPLAKKNPKRIFAIVVLTDGKDESSQLTIDELKRNIVEPAESSGATVRLFTIAYGGGADTRLLAELAEAGGGAALKGDTASIRQVYRDLAAFF